MKIITTIKKTLPLVTYLVCYCLLCGYFPDPLCDLSNFLYPQVFTEVFLFGRLRLAFQLSIT